jgi:uncharacterized metal-binding protein YceD (DUF177 family)
VTPEFSRLVALARIGRDGLRQEISATAAECEQLARRFGLLTLDGLAAVVELRRQDDAAIFLEAVFEAAFIQECVVTLEPVPGALSERFALVYGPPDAAPDDSEAANDAPAFEPLTGGAIDIGEAVAQELSLALPEFPRHPEAALAAGAGPPHKPRTATLARVERSDPG